MHASMRTKSREESAGVPETIGKFVRKQESNKSISRKSSKEENRSGERMIVTTFGTKRARKQARRKLLTQGSKQAKRKITIE